MLRTLAASAVIAILAALEVRAADCDANGVEDERDIADGAADCNANGTPDVCELTPSRLELSPAPAFEMKETVIACALAAMDGSPGPEAVTLSTSPSALITRRNDGNGAFGSPVELALQDSPMAGVFADLEGDGDADVALLLEDRVLPIWNDSGTLVLADKIPAGSRPGSGLAADLDGDGLLDLVTSNTLGTETSLSVSIILQTAGRGFGTARNYEAGPKAVGMAAADAENDGDIDLVVCHQDPLVSLFRNEGRGRFLDREPVPVGPGDQLHGISSGELDGDGARDLVVTRSSHGVEVLFGPVPGSRTTTFEMQFDMKESLIHDMDGDGASDLVLASRFLPRLWILLGRGRGVFDVRLSTVIEGPLLGMMPGDADGDGDVDLAAFSRTRFWVASSALEAALEDLDANRVPDVCETSPFLRGDALPDGALDLSDAIAILLALFGGQADGSCSDALDADDDGSLAIADAITVLLHLFQGGAGLPPPSGECGRDATGDLLTPCRGFTACGG